MRCSFLCEVNGNFIIMGLTVLTALMEESFPSHGKHKKHFQCYFS